MKKISKCLKRDFIVSKKIILLSVIIMVVINIIAFVAEKDFSTMTMVKSIIISSMILNLAVINYGFKQEEMPEYKYIIAMSDIPVQMQIIARFILFFIIPFVILLISLLFNMPVLIYVFAGVLLTSGLALFTYYRFGSSLIGIPFLFLFVLAYSLSSSNLEINLSSGEVIGLSLGIYILIIFLTILCEKLGWNTYSKIPKY